MTTVIINKPYGILSQFTPRDGHASLADFGLPGEVYVSGRLDHDSEGLLILTSDGRLQSFISDPKHKTVKTYWAQVERKITAEAIKNLQKGLVLKDGPTLPCEARSMEEPALLPRDPPIRFRKTVPTSWVEIKLREGRNRQVRRMLANVGFPVLRLLRYAIGPFTIEGLAPGQWRELTKAEIKSLGV
ncbi:MAG: pseudouridine synthase [Elusimicrobia bacterium]|nr:pseudouridine synthase [Elusimicrobiota bacterium]